MRRAFLAIIVFALFAAVSAADGQDQAKASSACSLLSRAAISKATGLSVAKGKEGPPIAGSLSNCTWLGPNGAKIVVTVADAPHMQMTVQSQIQSGATQFQGIGTSAVGTAGNAETEGGYNMSILDAKGGVAISILGNEGNGERAVALAKAIEARR